MNLLVFSFIFSLLLGCTQYTCNEVPASFITFSSAKRTIEETAFEFEEEIDTKRSSWIRVAKYFSCNGKTGYLLIETESASYFHSKVPHNLWKNFKTAHSMGGYYNSHLKGKYQLTLQP